MGRKRLAWVRSMKPLVGVPACGPAAGGRYGRPSATKSRYLTKRLLFCDTIGGNGLVAGVRSGGTHGLGHRRALERLPVQPHRAEPRETRRTACGGEDRGCRTLAPRRQHRQVREDDTVPDRATPLVAILAVVVELLAAAHGSIVVDPRPRPVATSTSSGSSPVRPRVRHPQRDNRMNDFLMLCAAVGGVVAALVAVWNAFQFSRLKGRVDELSRQLSAHVNTPGLHGR